jgi:hypothetical protein
VFSGSCEVVERATCSLRLNSPPGVVHRSRSAEARPAPGCADSAKGRGIRPFLPSLVNWRTFASRSPGIALASVVALGQTATLFARCGLTMLEVSSNRCERLSIARLLAEQEPRWMCWAARPGTPTCSNIMQVPASCEQRRRGAGPVDPAPKSLFGSMTVRRACRLTRQSVQRQIGTASPAHKCCFFHCLEIAAPRDRRRGCGVITLRVRGGSSSKQSRWSHGCYDSC